jgi:hypothetical protein
MSVAAFEHPTDSGLVSWLFNTTRVIKQYASPAQAIPLASYAGVLIVEPYDGVPNNAVIYNADGSERVRLVNPMVAHGAICFDDAYYVGAELTVIAAMQGSRFACVFDETGMLQRVYETR